MALILSEYLQVTNEGNRHIQCRKCAHNISSVDKNYKLYTVMKEESVQTANPQNVDSRQYVDKDMVFRRFFCPNCATQLETEVNVKGEPPVWDIHIKI
ncbi:acetone carboxylase subunit gamma [Paenibacillus validus]|nr:MULTISPECIES: acetone carboxylase subunit gamma [Paenibacillus]MED4601625.1 acetone carboxylase subunit gamma [Paenibacillus validus]MED4605632.1 acetone carboxylase subunit gamma [Paenibacillus validus]